MDMKQDADVLQRVVLAGMKTMYDPKVFPTFKQGITKNAALPDILATEAAGLIKMLDGKAQERIPRHIIAPAATMLLIEMARFMSDAGLADPTEEEIREAIMKLMAVIMKAYNVRAPQGQEQQAPGQQTEQQAPVPPQQSQPAGLMEA